MNTLEMVNSILGNNELKYESKINGKLNIAYYNINGGISVDKENKNSSDRKNLILSGDMLNAEWKLHSQRFSFIEAINSNCKIKSELWEDYKTISESLYDLLDYKTDKVIELINGYWNVEGK